MIVYIGKNGSRFTDVLNYRRKAYRKSRWKRWRARLFNGYEDNIEVGEDG